MAKTTPERKVGLVQFSNEIVVAGDGSKPPEVVAGDKLLNYEFLLENGQL